MSLAQRSEVTGVAAGSGLRMDFVRRVGYAVSLAAGDSLAPLRGALAEALGSREAFVVVDAGVRAAIGPQLPALLAGVPGVRGTMTIDGGESAKTLDSVAAICSQAADIRLRRDGCFVVLGGGVVMDLVGLAASLFRRGTAYVRVPTTLLGMIDAGVGLKVGVNLAGRKNLLGAFYPPAAALIDLGFLATLPDAELANGTAELLKIALTSDADLFDLCVGHAREMVASFRRGDELAEVMVRRAVEAMLVELSRDPLEGVHRRPLDLGHTFSPHLEARSAYALGHGRAVGLDILLCAAVGDARGVSRGLFETLVSVYEAVGLSTQAPDVSAAELHASLAEVRAHRGGDLNLVLIEAPGRPVFVQDIAAQEISAAMERLRAL